MFFKLERNVLIVTDKDRTGGILATDGDEVTASTLSNGYTRLLWDAFFEDEKARPPSKTVESALERVRPGLLGGRTLKLDMLRDRRAADVNRLRKTGSDTSNSVSESGDEIERVFEATPGLKMDDKAGKLGKITRRRVKQGFFELGDVKAWHPEGEMWVREADGYVICFVEGIKSLKGALRPQPEVSIAGFQDFGPVIGAASSGCAVCPACATCGACVLCAQVNYSVAAAAFAAATAIANAANSFNIDPGLMRDDFDILRFRDQRREALDDLQSRIKKINDILE